MMASGMSTSEKKRALWDALREIRLDSNESSGVKRSKTAKNISSISTDILSAGCGSCACCKNIEVALKASHNTSLEKRSAAQINVIAPTPSTAQSAETFRNETCWEQDDTGSPVQDRSLTLLEADSVQASAEVSTKKKRKKRRVRLTLPSLTRKNPAKQKASTPNKTKSPRKLLFESVTASAEQVPKLTEKTKTEQKKPPSQNDKAEANTKTPKQKMARAKKATGKDAKKTSSQNDNLELNVNTAKQKQTKGKKKKAAIEDSPPSGNNCDGLQKRSRAVTKSSKSVKQKLNSSNTTSPQGSKKVEKRNAKKRRLMSRRFDSDESEDSAAEEDPEYLNKTVNASTKFSSSPRKKKKLNKEGLPRPLKISETLKSRQRPTHILANIDNQVFKISVKENNAEFRKKLSRKLGRRGGASLNSSVLNESVNFKPTEKKKKLYSDRAWTSSQLFMSLCGQSE